MNDYVQVAVQAAQAAGALQRRAFREPVRVKETTRHDVKLETDLECEALIRSLLRAATPECSILGEEEGGELQADRPAWVVDPLDGTVNFSRKVPHFCTSIALYRDGRPVVGVIYQPLLDELYTAVAGEGAFLNGERLQVSTRDLSESMLAMGFSKLDAYITGMLEELHELAYVVKKVRIMGAAALDLAYVAAGRYDGFLEFGLRTWDIAAGVLLIREAGGRADLIPRGEHVWDVRADNGQLWS